MRLFAVLLLALFTVSAIDCDQPMCKIDEDCRVSCEGQVERLRARADPPPALVASDCSLAFNGGEDFQTPETPTCTCLGPAGSIALLFDADTCFATGRLGNCIYGGADFGTCTPGDITMCEDDCEAFNVARETDAAFAFGDAALAAPHCTGLTCECSIDVLDGCVRQRFDGLNVGGCQ